MKTFLDQARDVYLGPCDSGATFSRDRVYRWSLWRRWKSCRPNEMIAFVGLNPSTADETEDDPTVRRCINFAKAWGYPGMLMMNAFAFRGTDPQDMRKAEDPVGEFNDLALLSVHLGVKKTVCCWGNHGLHRCRGDLVEQMLRREKGLFIFGLTKAGCPKHPLYLPNTSELQLWTAQAKA